MIKNTLEPERYVSENVRPVRLGGSLKNKINLLSPSIHGSQRQVFSL